MKRIAFCALSVLVLQGCAAQQAQPQKQWYNSALDNQTAQSRFVIDRGECQMLAMKSVSDMPPPSAPRTSYIPAPTSTQVELISRDGQRYYGEIYSPPVQTFADGAGAVAAAQREQAAWARYQEAETAKANLFLSCMYRRGWELR